MGASKYDERAYGTPEHQHAQRRMLQVFERLGLNDAIIAACYDLHRGGGHNVFDAIAQALIELSQSRAKLMAEWARLVVDTVTPVMVLKGGVLEPAPEGRWPASFGRQPEAAPGQREIPGPERLAQLLAEAFNLSPEFTAAEIEIVRQGLEAAHDDEALRKAELTEMMVRLAPQPIRPVGRPVDEAIGEWRCACAPDPIFDTSINPAYVQRCARCGIARPGIPL